MTRYGCTVTWKETIPDVLPRLPRWLVNLLVYRKCSLVMHYSETAPENVPPRAIAYVKRYLPGPQVGHKAKVWIR